MAEFRARLLELTATVATHLYWATLGEEDVVAARMALKHAHEPAEALSCLAVTYPTWTRTVPLPRGWSGSCGSCGRPGAPRVRELEVQEEQERRRRERARAEQSWKIQPKRSGETALLHRGGCTLYNALLGFISREDAVIALEEPDIEPCQRAVSNVLPDSRLQLELSGWWWPLRVAMAAA
ncbi:DUF6233 domain-containing protein, partial [Streptomyces sp. NPDC058240]|uniref:DUF6233 domain-containing protein n=1 Tax=Streptomyces sp. NPDC058240 TaxID=3346396 RepID=UPI0036E193DF